MKAFAIKEHRTDYPNPISFDKGERLQLGELDSEYKGWIKVITAQGKKGWAPVSYIEENKGTSIGVARRYYSAFELSVNLKEKLEIQYEECSWCWVKNTKGMCGWVPRASIEMV